MPPRVSIIVPTWNRRESVKIAVESALGQTYADVEVVVVDDGSTDGTSEALARRFRDDRLVLLRKENGGTASARNLGIERARGAYVAFLDSDDRYLPGFAARMVEALEADAGAALAFSDVRYVGETGHRWTTLLARHRPPATLDDMLFGGWYLVTGMLVRTGVARALLFDPAAYIEDTEFLFRFLAAGHRVTVVREVLAEYVQGAEGQKSRSALVHRRAMLELQERWASRASDPRAHRTWLHYRRARYHLRAGEPAEARRHAWAWWRARPLSPAAWALLLRTRWARRAAGSPS